MSAQSRKVESASETADASPAEEPRQASGDDTATPPKAPAAAAHFAELLGRALIFAIILGTPLAVWTALRTPLRSQIYFFEILTFGGGAVWLALRALNPRPNCSGLTFPGAALGFGSALVALSALLSHKPAYAFGMAGVWFGGVLLYALIRETYGAGRHPNWLLAALVALAAGLAALGVAQGFGWDPLQYTKSDLTKNPIVSTFGHPNFFASFVGPAMLLALALAARSRGWISRGLALIAALVMALGLAMARARGVWLGSALGLGVAAALVLLAKPAGETFVVGRIKRALLIGGGAVAALAAVALMSQLSPKSLRDAARVDATSQIENRIYYWRVAADIASAAPIFGLGPGGFGREFWRAAEKLQESPEGPLFRRNLVAMTGEKGAINPEHVHNDYLERLIESGPLALWAHLAFMGYLVVFGSAKVLRARGRPGEGLLLALLIGALICAAVDGVFSFPLKYPAGVIMFFMISAVLLSEIEAPEGTQREAGEQPSPSAPPASPRESLIGRVFMGSFALASLIMAFGALQRGRSDLIMCAVPQPSERMPETGLNEGVTRLQKSLRLNPDNYEAAYLRASYLGLLGRRDEAIAEIDRAHQVYAAIESFPVRAEHAGLAGDWKAAREELAKMTRVSVVDRSGFQRRMRAHRKLEEWPELEAVAREVEIRWPDEPDAIVSLGNVAAAQNDPTLALKCFLLAISAPANVDRALPRIYDMAEVRSAMGQARREAKLDRPWARPPKSAPASVSAPTPPAQDKAVAP